MLSKNQTCDGIHSGQCVVGCLGHLETVGWEGQWDSGTVQWDTWDIVQGVPSNPGSQGWGGQ